MKIFSVYCTDSWKRTAKVSFCWQLKTSINSDLKVHALQYANELLVRVRLSFQKLLQIRSTWRNNTKKMFKRIQTTINHISILTFLCFFTTISTLKKMCFFFRARTEKGVARHIDASSVVWTLVIFDWFVLSMRMQVILDSPFARPGSAPIGGGKKGEFRDWTTLHLCMCSCFCQASENHAYWAIYRIHGCLVNKLLKWLSHWKVWRMLLKRRAYRARNSSVQTVLHLHCFHYR